MTEAASKIMGNDSRKGRERQTGLGLLFLIIVRLFIGSVALMKAST